MKTKKSLLICLTAVVLCVAGVALAKAVKVELEPCPINYPDPENLPPGGASVVFNNSAGAGHNLELTVSLKGVEAGTAYDIYLFVDGGWHDGAKAGTVTTNKRGNANFHLNTLLEKGEHTLAIDVTKEGSGADVYETPGIHSGDGTVMTFK
ncbi:MAG: hypothetical protein ACYTDV_09360 [Planctomycetota bacterium]